MLLEIATAVAPVLVTVTGCELPLVKLSDEGDTVTVGVADATPEPDNGAVCVVPAVPFELSVTVSVAASPLVVEGSKVTLIVQLEPAAIEVQLFVCAKSAAFVPLMATEETVSVAVPELAKVSVCAGVVVPSTVVAKLRDPGEGEKSASGAAPMPVREMVCGEPAALSAMLTVAV
jgi:hypothetical protein